MRAQKRERERNQRAWKIIEGVTSDGEKGDIVANFFGKEIC